MNTKPQVALNASCIFLYILLAAPVFMTSCDTQSGSFENNIIFHDHELQTVFVNELRANGIKFREEGGKVFYDYRIKDEIDRISNDVIHDKSHQNYYWNQNTAVQEYFVQRLTESKIPFEVLNENGKAFVVWDITFKSIASNILDDVLVFEHEMKKRQLLESYNRQNN